MTNINRSKKPKKTADFIQKRQEDQFELKALYAELDEIENVGVSQLIQDAQVIATTLTSIYDSRLQKAMRKTPGSQYFDVTVLDEAAQASELASWAAVLVSKKVIFAGDHKQLPPLVRSDPSSKSLFEIISARADAPRVMSMLVEQYRMHEDIMHASSSYFYKSMLKAADCTFRDIPRVFSDVVKDKRDCPSMILIDTHKHMYGEVVKNLDSGHLKEPSKANEGEASLVCSVILSLIKGDGLAAADIGVISPYSAQVELIRTKLNLMKDQSLLHEMPEVSTVDSFQGREMPVIVISAVRSNPEHEIGFLSEERRMNVAITRAQRLLVLICDTKTAQVSPFFGHLIQQVRARGSVRTPDDIVYLNNTSLEFDPTLHFGSGLFGPSYVVKQEKEKVKEQTKEPEKKTGKKKKNAKREKSLEEKKRWESGTGANGQPAQTIPAEPQG